MRSPRFSFALLAFFVARISFAQGSAATSSDAEKRVDSILSKMTLAQKIDYLGGVNEFYIRAMPELNLPAFKMADGPVGVRNFGPSTTLGAGIALAATWDPELVRRAGVVLGEDARARGVHFLLGPGVNIYRAPMDGRNFEYFGEDPFLAAQTAVAYIEGLQSQGVCATVKHYMGNNSEYDRHNTDSIIDERTMREIYLPTFEAAVHQAHVCAIMDSYNLTNGEHMTQNNYLNNEVAKKEWGFDGIIMSDWTSTYDGVAAVNGGLDLEMPRARFMNREILLPAIKSGTVSEATIDEHVRRILRKAIEFGWLDRDQTENSIPLYNPEGRAVALEEARSAMVLLKNDGNLLPLDRSKIKTVALVGPDAYPAEEVGGGSAAVHPFHAVSFLEGLTNYLGDQAKVLYQPGIPTLAEMAAHTAFVSDQESGKSGLKVEYFDSKDLAGPPVRTTLEEHVNFGGENPLPEDFHSARWTGYYVAKDAGSYHVFVEGLGEEGGVRLYFDDKLIIDNWNRYTALADDVPMELTAGTHKIRFEAYRSANWSNPVLRVGIVNAATVVSSEARDLAEHADAVIVAVGFDPHSESEGSDRTFALPSGQDELIQAMLAANKNVIVVITSGGGVDMSKWVDHTPALLQSWYPGQEGGTALAQLLFGEYSPSGKLPISIERRFEDNPVAKNYYPNDGDNRVKYNEGVFLGYRYYDKSTVKPLFPFGYGLSYTSFRYTNLVVLPETASGDHNTTVSFDVTNTGQRKGAEVAELYVGEVQARVPRPVKELKGFARVDLKPGETRKVSLTLDRRSLAYYDPAAKQWMAVPGEFRLFVGGSSTNIRLKGKLLLAH